MPAMSSPIACMLCSIDPGAVNLVVPIAQATIITLPIFFREQIKRGAGAVIGRTRSTSRDADAPLETPDDAPGERDTRVR